MPTEPFDKKFQFKEGFENGNAFISQKAIETQSISNGENDQAKLSQQLLESSNDKAKTGISIRDVVSS